MMYVHTRGMLMFRSLRADGWTSDVDINGLGRSCSLLAMQKTKGVRKPYPAHA